MSSYQVFVPVLYTLRESEVRTGRQRTWPTHRTIVAKSERKRKSGREHCKELRSRSRPSGGGRFGFVATPLPSGPIRSPKWSPEVQSAKICAHTADRGLYIALMLPLRATTTTRMIVWQGKTAGLSAVDIDNNFNHPNEGLLLSIRVHLPIMIAFQDGRPYARNGLRAPPNSRGAARLPSVVNLRLYENQVTSALHASCLLLRQHFC